jgi:hypothetical protein
MLPIKKSAESSRRPVAKTAPNAPGSKAGKPAASGASTPTSARGNVLAADPIRTAPKGTPASAQSGSAASKSQSKPKAAGSSGSGKPSARREAHISHASVAPAGRDGRGGGGGGGFSGSGRQGHPDIQDWMPFSAQQSRIARMPRTYPAVGLTKVIAHPVHPLRAAVLFMAGRFYSEVLPSLFRRTPKEMERNDREIRKDALRKEQKHRSERDEARRDTVRKRAEADPRRVMAGDLTTAFARA